jgi:hypothetical protein
MDVLPCCGRKSACSLLGRRAEGRPGRAEVGRGVDGAVIRVRRPGIAAAGPSSAMEMEAWPWRSSLLHALGRSREESSLHAQTREREGSPALVFPAS